MTPPDGLFTASENLLTLILRSRGFVKTGSQWKHLGPLLLACALGLLGTAVSPALAIGAEALVGSLEDLEQTHAGLCPLPRPTPPLRDAVRRWAAEVRGVSTPGSNPHDIVAALNRVVFENLALKPSQDLHDPCNLLPSAVLQRKQGYCVGVAAVYLALAQELDLPIFAVSTPSHVFLRYDDGTTRINIETTQMGVAKPDEAYVREGKIPERSIRKRIFLRNLSTDDFLAQVYNNLGVVYSERKDYAAAEREYQAALDLDRYLPAAWYNLGNDLLAMGNYRGAVKSFTRSLGLYPTDVWALNNRGVAYRKHAKVEKALQDFEEALRIEPGFEEARKNLEALPHPP